jgi:hypothetical protein
LLGEIADCTDHELAKVVSKLSAMVPTLIDE